MARRRATAKSRARFVQSIFQAVAISGFEGSEMQWLYVDDSRRYRPDRPQRLLRRSHDRDAPEPQPLLLLALVVPVSLTTGFGIGGLYLKEIIYPPMLYQEIARLILPGYERTDSNQRLHDRKLGLIAFHSASIQPHESPLPRLAACSFRAFLP